MLTPVYARADDGQSADTVTYTNATDLPIDITAIGRQNQGGIGGNQPLTRFGTHLFTPDAQVVNEAMAEQIRRRQETVLYLFEAISFDYTIDAHTQLVSNTSNLALFGQPSNFSHITIPQETNPLPLWVFVVVLFVCAVVGLARAMIARAKKTKDMENTSDVH